MLITGEQKVLIHVNISQGRRLMEQENGELQT